MKKIFLDHASTSPLVPAAIEEMVVVAREGYGNPSSSHAEGIRAKNKLEEYRSRISSVLDCAPSEIVFTSGATESNNIALNTGSNMALITSRSEHKAVLEPSSNHNADVDYVQPNSDGVVTLSSVSEVYNQHRFASLMLVNNETGAITDIENISSWAHENNILMHCDAVQALAYGDLSFSSLGVDLLSLSAHKIGGPTGVGLLVRRSGVHLRPVSVGGGQERSFRPGTENLLGIAGFCRALEFVTKEASSAKSHVRSNKNLLFDGLNTALGLKIELNGSLDEDLSSPHILNCSFRNEDGEYVDAELLQSRLSRMSISVSTGSACNAGAIDPSHVLRAMGHSRERAAGSIRFSLGRTTSHEDVQLVIEAVVGLLNQSTMLSNQVK